MEGAQCDGRVQGQGTYRQAGEVADLDRGVGLPAQKERARVWPGAGDTGGDSDANRRGGVPEVEGCEEGTLELVGVGLLVKHEQDVDSSGPLEWRAETEGSICVGVGSVRDLMNDRKKDIK